MNYRKIIPGLILWSGLLALSAQTPVLQIDNREIYGTRQRPPVRFTHLQHMMRGTACLQCHHDYREGRNVLQEKDLTAGNPALRCPRCHGKTNGPGRRYAGGEAYQLQCLG